MKLWIIEDHYGGLFSDTPQVHLSAEACDAAFANEGWKDADEFYLGRDLAHGDAEEAAIAPYSTEALNALEAKFKEDMDEVFCYEVEVDDSAILAAIMLQTRAA